MLRQEASRTRLLACFPVQLLSRAKRGDLVFQPSFEIEIASSLRSSQ
jgi:hypothetical protein